MIGYCSNSGCLLPTKCLLVAGISVVLDISQTVGPFISYIGILNCERSSRFLIVHTLYLIYSTTLVVIDFVHRTWHLLVSLSGENVLSVDQYCILHVAQE